MPLIKQKRIYREDLKANTDVLYVFGDNYERVGLGGQAGEMRGEANAIGVRTKKSPGNLPQDFLTDATLMENQEDILEDFKPIIEALSSGQVVVFPLDGLGTGLANLQEYAPKTLEFINGLINSF